MVPIFFSKEPNEVNIKISAYKQLENDYIFPRTCCDETWKKNIYQLYRTKKLNTMYVNMLPLHSPNWAINEKFVNVQVKLQLIKKHAKNWTSKRVGKDNKNGSNQVPQGLELSLQPSKRLSGLICR